MIFSKFLAVDDFTITRNNYTIMNFGRYLSVPEILATDKNTNIVYQQQPFYNCCYHLAVENPTGVTTSESVGRRETRTPRAAHERTVVVGRKPARPHILHRCIILSDARVIYSLRFSKFVV